MSHAHKKAFDPIQHVKRLESVGFTRAQAEVQSETFSSIVAQEHLATKEDLKASEKTLREELKASEKALREDFKTLRADVKAWEKAIREDLKASEKATRQDTKMQIELLRRDLKIWLGGMLVTLVAVFSALPTLTAYFG